MMLPCYCICAIALCNYLSSHDWVVWLINVLSIVPDRIMMTVNKILKGSFVWAN